jgi:DNA-directed RNA polymerase specialized sigma24 family protein
MGAVAHDPVQKGKALVYKASVKALVVPLRKRVLRGKCGEVKGLKAAQDLVHDAFLQLTQLCRRGALAEAQKAPKTVAEVDPDIFANLVNLMFNR